MRYAAGCECSYLRPNEVDAIWDAANGIRDELKIMPLGLIALDYDNDQFKTILVYFITRFALWQSYPSRPLNWAQAADTKVNMEEASEHIQFPNKTTGCNIVISHKESGAWVERASLKAPPELLVQCLRLASSSVDK
jgi:hypothetical protein